MNTFNEAINKLQKCEQLSINYSKQLQTFPKGVLGLTPDDVRNSVEFKQCKDNYAIAVHNMKALNTYLTKNYKKEFKHYQQNRRNNLLTNK